MTLNMSRWRTSTQRLMPRLPYHRTIVILERSGNNIGALWIGVIPKAVSTARLESSLTTVIFYALRHGHRCPTKRKELPSDKPNRRHNRHGRPIVVARYACKLLGIDYDTVVVNALIYCEILRAIKEGDR